MTYILIEGTEQHALIRVKKINSDIKEMLELLIQEYFNWMNPSIVAVLEGDIIYKDSEYKVYEIIDLVEEVKIEQDDIIEIGEWLEEEEISLINLRNERLKEVLPVLQKLIDSGEI